MWFGELRGVGDRLVRFFGFGRRISGGIESEKWQELGIVTGCERIASS